MSVQQDTWLKVLDDAVRSLLFNKFKDKMDLSTENEDVVFFPKSIAQREVAEKRGEDGVEFINFWTTNIGLAWSRQRTPTARRGFPLEFTDGNKTDIITAQAVPADITYDVWFWSKDKDLLQAVCIDWLFWLHDNPKLYLMFNNTYPLESYLSFGAVADESTVEQKYEVGQYFVKHATLTMESWIIRAAANTKTVLKIHIAVYDNLGGTPILLRDWWIQ